MNLTFYVNRILTLVLDKIGALRHWTLKSCGSTTVSMNRDRNSYDKGLKNSGLESKGIKNSHAIEGTYLEVDSWNKDSNGSMDI